MEIRVRSVPFPVCQLLVSSVVFWAACSTTPEATPDDVQIEAEAQFHHAVSLLNEGEITESWRAMKEMNGIIDVFLEPDPMPGQRSANETTAMGRPLREWQEEWNKRYRLSVQTAWPTIRQAIEDESVDLSLLKGYVSEFLGRSYVDRVHAEYERLEPVFLARRARQYYYSCDDIGDLCGIARDVVSSRMPPGTVTTSWTGDIDDYRGRVETTVQVIREVTYRKGNESRGRLPETAQVTLSITTAGGTSRWDGVHTYTMSGDLPSSIRPHELARLTREHWETLRRDLETKMSAWPEGRGP